MLLGRTFFTKIYKLLGHISATATFGPFVDATFCLLYNLPFMDFFESEQLLNDFDLNSTHYFTV